MIVVQGSEKIQNADTPATFTLSIDNKNINISNSDEFIKYDSYVDPDGKMAKYDSSDDNGSVNVTIHATINDVTNFSLTEATAIGKVYTINPPSTDVDGLSKEDYLREMASFIDTHVDVEAGTSGWNSKINGHITCFAENIEVKKNCLSLLTTVQKGNNITFSYNAVDFKKLFEQDGADYFICYKIKAKGTGTVAKTGAVGTVEFTYSHASDYPIANGVFGLSSANPNFITFDDNIHMVSGWLDSLDISYQQRSIVKTKESMYAPMFTYLFYSAVAPKYFNANIEKMAFCGQISQGLYRLPWVVTNNASFGIIPAEVYVTARGPKLTGDPKVTSTIDTVSFDTGDVNTSSSRVLLDLTISGSVFKKHTFELPCGIGKGEFVTSAVDCKIAMDTTTNIGNLGRISEVAAGNLVSFHSLINGFENALSCHDFDRYMLQTSLVFFTKGLSCMFNTNTLQFVFYLIYEMEKEMLRGAERNSMMMGIYSVVDRHNANLAGVSTNVPKELRKKMSKQYLSTVSWKVFKLNRDLSGSGSFIWFAYCVPITFYFNRDMFWLPTAPNVGVPLKINILENAELDNGTITDDHVAMMKKHMTTNIFESRIDWILNSLAISNIKQHATLWVQMGETVVLKKDGRHQEFYAINDNGYKIGDYNSEEHAPEYVSIPGDIGEQWNKWKKEVVHMQEKISHIHPITSTLVGKPAENFVENFRAGYPMHYIFNGFTVIDLTNQTLIKEGKTTKVKFLRPNKNVIIVLKNEGLSNGERTENR